MYEIVKQIHLLSVTLTLALMLLRGGWMIRDSHRLQQRWVKIVPHVVDTVLLGSALTLVVMSSQYPFVESWLTAKVIAVVVYILLGTIAIKRGRTKTIRVIALIAALLVFVSIVLMAVNKTPLLMML